MCTDQRSLTLQVQIRTVQFGIPEDKEWNYLIKIKIQILIHNNGNYDCQK